MRAQGLRFCVVDRRKMHGKRSIEGIEEDTKRRKVKGHTLSDFMSKRNAQALRVAHIRRCV